MKKYTSEFIEQLAFYKILLFLLAASSSCHFVNLFLLLYLPAGEYEECHAKFYKSQRRISYIYITCVKTLNSFNRFLAW